MGQHQSKDELLYQQVNSGNSEGIKTLRNEGAGLEWVDNEGKTPLIVACMNLELYNVAKTLIELGANVNAYCPGRYAGTPLHHAAKRGLEQTVKLLLSHGANALVMNDACQTPLDIARAKGYTNVVRAIEGQVCLFSGWLRELHGPSFIELLAPQLLSRKVWVVVLPCGSRNSKKPFKLELAIYSGPQDAQPRTIVLLWKANLEEPNYNQADPTAIISDISRIRRRWKRKRGIKSSQEARRSRIKLVPMHESEIQQLQRFCNACKGIPQVLHPLFPFNNQPPPTAPAAPPTVTEDEESESDESTSSVSSSMSTGSNYKKSNNNKASTSQEAPAQHFQTHNTTVPLVIQIENPAVDNGPIQYPSIEMSHVDVSLTNVEATRVSGDEMKKYGGADSSSCTICLDAPLEGACIPCGHMAGCMTCLNEIKAKKWGCPVCRAKIDQVIRIYAV